MSKKADTFIIVVFILIGLLLFGGTGYIAYNTFIAPKTADKKLISLDLYGYTLSKRDNSLYKGIFKDLEKALNEDSINYSDYAKYASELFVIDVFTLNNKNTSTDIGGLEFVHKGLRENFKENLGASLYKNVENNLNGKRTQKLPEVKDIRVDNITQTTFTYNKVDYEGYLVDLSWDYEIDLGYQKSIKLTLIKDNGKLFIVKGQ